MLFIFLRIHIITSLFKEENHLKIKYKTSECDSIWFYLIVLQWRLISGSLSTSFHHQLFCTVESTTDLRPIQGFFDMNVYCVFLFYFSDWVIFFFLHDFGTAKFLITGLWY